VPNPSPKGSRARPAGWLKSAARIAVTVGVTWFILRRLGVQFDDASSISWDSWAPSWGWIGLSVLVLVLGFLASARIWSVIVADLGGPSLHLGDAGYIVFVSNLGRYIPGKVWQIAGMAWLAGDRGVPPALAAIAAVLGTGVALVAAAAVGIPALLELGTGPLFWTVLLGLMTLITIVVIPSVFRRGLGLALRLVRSEHQVVPGNLHGLRWLCLYGVNWLIYALAFGLFAAGSGAPVSVLAAGTALAAAYVIGYVAFFAPAGAGVREAGLVALLAGTLAPTEALVLAVAGRIWITGVELIVALLFLGGARKKTGKGEEEDSDGSG